MKEAHMFDFRAAAQGSGCLMWLLLVFFPEEVLHTQVAHWWSPKGTKLAYLAINDTLVPNMLLPQLTGSLYPRGKQYPYPKVGFTFQSAPVFSFHSRDFSCVVTNELM